MPNNQNVLLRTSCLSVLVYLLSSSSGCVETGDAKAVDSPAGSASFIEIKNVIPFEDRNRRKFDAPVIGDLDQDGLSDVIVNEHGLGMRIFWNDGATFSEGPYIANGDVHGAAISDFNKDGKLDIIITQGGGDGGNPRRPLWVEVSKNRAVTKGKAFDYFEPGRGRAVNFLSEPETGALNLFVTGFPMPKQKAEGANHYYKNSGGGAFEFVGTLPQAKWLGYRPRLTDFNGDNIQDIIMYGGANMVAIAGQADGSFDDVTQATFGALANTNDVSSMTEIDFDNDGDQDLFLTRAEHQFDIESYYDPETRRFAFISFRKAYFFADLQVDGDLIIENLQRTYPHRNVYLGASKTPMTFEGDPHGHQDVTIKPSEAAGWPKGETKEGLYIGYMGGGKWRIAGQSQSRTAATFRNVDAAPMTTPQKDYPATLFENREGVFFDVSGAMGINTPDQTTGATSADFNNDGWLDLAVLRYGSMATSNPHVLYLNEGGTGFRAVDNNGIYAMDEVGTTGGFAQAFDYNADGQMDIIYSNERGKWHLLKNQMADASANNFVTVRVGNSPKGGSPLGAQLSLAACGETYSRRVGMTSAAFSQNYDTALHVGIGECDEASAATVTWVDGTAQELKMIKPSSIVSLP